MNRAYPHLAFTVLLLACAVLLSACFAGAKPSTLHSLRPMAQERLGSDFAGWGEMILVMPVRLAPQLQERSLLLRNETGETTASLNHRWAGPLDQEIAETIAVNLKTLLGTDNVGVYPGPRYGLTRYQLEVEMSGFTSDRGIFTLQAVYTISDATAKTMLQRKSVHITQAIDKPDLSGYVEAASRSVDQLSRTMAEALIAVRQSQPVPKNRP